MELKTLDPDSIDPEYTRRYTSLPMNGSGTDLNANAENGAFSSDSRVISVSSLYDFPLIASISFGEGK